MVNRKLTRVRLLFVAHPGLVILLKAYLLICHILGSNDCKPKYFNEKDLEVEVNAQ